MTRQLTIFVIPLARTVGGCGTATGTAADQRTTAKPAEPAQTRTFAASERRQPGSTPGADK